MTAFYHVGILVEDLDQAIPRFSELLPLTFGPPRTMQIEERDPATGELRSRSLRFIYSDEGPPYVELVEAQIESHAWGRHLGEGLHHIGFWQSGFDEFLPTLASLGHAVATLMPNPDNATASYLDPASLHGTRVELVCPFSERKKPT